MFFLTTILLFGEIIDVASFPVVALMINFEWVQ